MRKRRISLDNDIPLLKPLDDILARAPRMDLILADINPPAASLLDVLLEFVEMVDSVVGDAD